MGMQRLAEVALGNMIQKQREDGSKFWAHKEDAPKWVTDLCHYAHGEMLPDDWRYEFIFQALEIISSGGEDDELEADVYMSDLLKWLSSNVNRQGYVDEAVENFGYPGSIIEAIQLGQLEEKREVYFSVRNFLEKKADEMIEKEEN